MASKGPVHTPAKINASAPGPQGTAPVPVYENNANNSKKGLVVIQEWWGLNESLAKEVDEFANAGFYALAPDLYRGKVAADREEAGHLKTGLDFQAAVNDIGACVDYLLRKGCGKVGVVGFCMGGALVISSVAGVSKLSGAAAYYGCPDLSTLSFKHVTYPVQLHFGRLDAAKGFSDPETAEKLREKLVADGVDGTFPLFATLFMYENAGHAFTNRDRPEACNEEARSTAFQRTWDYFNKVLA